MKSARLLFVFALAAPAACNNTTESPKPKTKTSSQQPTPAAAAVTINSETGPAAEVNGKVIEREEFNREYNQTMERLSREKNAFIRPSPSQSHLGGVARRTREAIALCEAAGYDVVLIETVGVGQSETVVSELSDLFLLLLAPAGGDELQGVKRGIMEMADIILINKADGDLKATATRTCADYAGALRLLRKRPQDPEGFPKAMTVSAVEEKGLEQAWDEIQSLTQWRRDNGIWDANRSAQARYWFDQEVRHALLARLDTPQARAEMERLNAEVSAGHLNPAKAAEELLSTLT